MPQLLAHKERGLFTQLVKNYEGKQYRKALKAADAVLKKYPDHGDTQAMKALVLNSQGQKDEAFTLAKQALKCDMKSHVCWHVYGLLYKDAKNFEEAIKAYKFALKLQPDSLQIQRDLAFLQMQFRDYTGYIQSRHAMLQANPDQRQNWTALAVAQHFGGQLENAENTLSIYEETLKNPPPKTDDRHQQAGLYKNMIIAEMGETERALEHLNAVGKTIYDKQLVMELRAEYLLKLNRKSEAEEVYWELLRRNQENRAYYRGLQSAKSISESDVKALQTMYEECLTKYPNSDACQRIPLDFLAGKDFREAADGYLRRIYKVPSAFSNIKALYSEHSKQEVIQELMEGYRESCLSETTNGTIKSESTKDDLETTILFFLAQHYNYHKSRDLSKALQFIEQAIERNPKSVDYQMTKARILKHKGNVQKASEVMEYARSLDTRDRYINTKAAKYQLRNNEHENALKTMSNFTRQDAAGGTLGDLVDMQSVWFLTEDGESYLRQNKLGLALKRSHWIYNIFDLWQEDQYDFHSFSFRRGQIRAYVDMIRWEDHLRDHPFYTRASILAIKAYLFLHDKPDVARGNLPNGVNGDKMDAKEKKKVARKARIEQEKKEQAEAEKKNAKLAAGGSTENEQKKVDKDPEGMQFLETQDPLKEALKFLLPMLESSTKSLEAQKAGFEVFLRRKKYLLALRCFLAVKSIAPDSPTYHNQLLRLEHAVQCSSSSLPPQVTEILDSELKPLLPQAKPDLKSLNEDYLATNSSAAAVFAGAEVRRTIDSSSDEKITEDFVKVVGQESTTLKEAQQGLDLLRYWDLPVGDYITAALKRWPEATVFV